MSPWFRRRLLPIAAIAVSWAAVGAVAYAYWPAETVCRVDRDQLMHEMGSLPIVTRFSPPVRPSGAAPYTLRECTLQVGIAHENADAIAPFVWVSAFLVWGQEIGGHGLPVVALERHDTGALVVLGDRCEVWPLIAEQLNDVWSRAVPQYPSLTISPVDEDFDPAVLKLDASYAPLWSDGTVATR